MDFFHLPFFFFFVCGVQAISLEIGMDVILHKMNLTGYYTVCSLITNKNIYFLCIGSNRKGSKINVKLALTFTHIRWHVEVRKC